MSKHALSDLSHDVLLQKFDALIAQDGSTTAALLAYLAEVDARRLHVSAGYPNLRTWCVGAKKMSEDVAAKRIRAARAARRFPAILSMIEDGRLTLSAVVLLAPRLTPENAGDLLAAATHQTNERIGWLLAERFPKADRPTLVMAVGDQEAVRPVEELSGEQAVRPVGELSGEPAVRPVGPPAPGARLTPLSAERIALQVTIGRDTHDKLRYAQDLLGRSVPAADIAQVLDRALDALVERLEKKCFAATARPRPSGKCHKDGSRYVPREVRRIVWQRDGGQCTFVGDTGHRCDACKFLELDHIDPFARGGPNTPDNLRLRCHAHNQYGAERTFGADFMKHKVEESRRVRAEAREAKRAAAAQVAQAREAARLAERERQTALQTRRDEIIPALRNLGYSQAEARLASTVCDTMPDATLVECIRAALRFLMPRGVRIERPSAWATT